VVVRIVSAGIVSNPMAIVMNMRRIRMTRSILEVPWLRCRRPMIWSRTLCRRRMPTAARMASSTSGMLLGPRRNRKDKYCRKQADNSLHGVLTVPLYSSMDSLVEKVGFTQILPSKHAPKLWAGPGLK
jgi:hypothetical protein